MNSEKIVRKETTNQSIKMCVRRDEIEISRSHRMIVSNNDIRMNSETIKAMLK